MAKRTRAAGSAGRRTNRAGEHIQRKEKNRSGTFFLWLQAIVSIILMIVILMLDMLPMKYLALAALVLLFLWCITFTSQAARKKKGTSGKVYSFLITCVLLVGTYYIAETNNMIAAITGGTTRVDKMAVAVLKDDYAQTIEDAADYNFGIQFRQGGDNIQTAMTNLQEELGAELTVTDCGSVQGQAADLFAGNVDAIIYNEKEVISAGRTDDISLTEGASRGWGWLCSKGADFIQTDWTTELLQFLKSGNKKRLNTRVGK